MSFPSDCFSHRTVWAGSHNHPAKQAPPSDPGYVFALAAANHFLHAWQTGDLENGTVLLSDGIRHSQNADKLEQFFSNWKRPRLRNHPRPWTPGPLQFSRSCWSHCEVPASRENLPK